MKNLSTTAGNNPKNSARIYLKFNTTTAGRWPRSAGTVWRLSSRAAWRALETVSLVEFELPGGQRKAGVCVNGEEGGPGSEAYQVLQALEVPQPPKGTDKTVY